MAASADDNSGGVARVEFLIDGQVFATDTSSPFSTQLITTGYSNANHTLSARAYDAAGNNTTSASRTITINNPTPPPVDTERPSVTLTSPSAGARLSGTSSPMRVNLDDNVAVTRVQFIVDGNVVHDDTQAPFEHNLNTTTLTNANHNFQARAYDAAGNNRITAVTTARVENRTIIAEDINESGVVDINDFTLLVSSFGRTGTGLGRSDIDGNQVVDINDFTRLVQRFGQVAQ